MPNYLSPASSTACFVADHADQILKAAHMLGGTTAARRFALLVQDLGEALAPNRRLERELDALETLLSLRHLDDPDNTGSSLFATIDPADPVVEEICALLDALQDCRAADRRAAA
jgi:hypothetical protein